MVITQSESRSQRTLATGDEPRIEMKSAGAATGYLDGGWWPRSTDPSVEFPALVRALHGVVGQVDRVAYNLDFWEPVHRKLTVDDRIVRCEGFHTMNPHTVTAVGVNSLRVTLLVVLPTTPDPVARAALRAAGDQDSTATVKDILTSSGARPEVGTASPGT
ncbi:DUF5994 family protein [Actinophytocola xanthii]|uniref:Uncharacterized protein n=1 Tax=Actinophytocola xanthii TaxID=1912961 RepID=A0A1Q8BWW9_9PSEU|nr:DUF5994 family protein [Actinophytocola xanthii]OLF06589.1 hypothetical protein BU204_36250 [Actinophytocola xanthii]